MIKYSLVCLEEHGFASWFRSSADYEEQRHRGLIECPTCGSTKVEKAVMAPHIARRDRAPAEPAEKPAEPAAKPQPMALLDENSTRVRAALRELRDRIVEASTDVGAQFPDQARRMHEGEIPTRPIRGQATAEEARELWEVGVPVMPIPVLPEEQN